MIKTVTPQELRKAFDAAEWNDYTLIETLPDGSEILVGDIFAAIAAAVATEREACAKIAQSNKSHTEHGELGECCDTAEEIAAAIRARSNGAGME